MEYNRKLVFENGREFYGFGFGDDLTERGLAGETDRKPFGGFGAGRFDVTEIGETVNRIMKEAFPSIIDEHFTAYMESLLDKVAEGVVSWYTVVSNFYPDLKDAVDQANAKLEKVEIEDEKTDVICEECGRNMVIKYGPHGKFLACPGFPECRNTKPYNEKAGVKCPLCGKEVLIRKTKKGRRYYSCEDNPECSFMSWQKPADKLCPRCGQPMVEKGNNIVCMNEQCRYIEGKNSEQQTS